MRKWLPVLLLLFAFSLAACGNGEEDPEPLEDPVAAEGHIIVWFYNSNEWDDVRVWAWNEDGNFYAAWPGDEAEQHGDTDWFYMEIPFEDGDEVGIIFNGVDGAVQTEDVDIIDDVNVYLTVNSEAFDSKEAAEASID